MTTISGARVFDGNDALGVASVTVEDGVVTAVRPMADDGTGDVDGRGMTLLPGLIDAHVHLRGAGNLGQDLRHGVTTVLDMFSAPPQFTAHAPEAGAGAHRRGRPAQLRADGRCGRRLARGDAPARPLGLAHARALGSAGRRAVRQRPRPRGLRLPQDLRREQRRRHPAHPEPGDGGRRVRRRARPTACRPWRTRRPGGRSGPRSRPGSTSSPTSRWTARSTTPTSQASSSARRSR